MPGQTVFVARSANSGTYHTDRSCLYLENGERLRPKDRSVISSDMELCDRCAGETPGGPPTEHTYRNALTNGNPEDFGLTPMLSD